MLARFWKLVSVAPGQKQVTVTPGAVQFIGQCFGEREHIGFCRVVNRHERAGHEGGGGGDVHDASAATGEHGREKQPGEVRKGRDIEIDLAENIRFGDLGEFAEGSEAGVVDEDVYGNAVALELVEEGFGRGRFGEIESDSLYDDAVRLEFGGNFREVLRAACNQN
jgi:hypothetical protein